MVRSKRRWFLPVGCAAWLWIAGCGSGSDEADVEEADLTEFVADSAASTDSNPQPPANAPNTPSPPASPSSLPMSTKEVGMIKTVTQQLRQRTPDGWNESKTSLELTIAVSPEPPIPPPAQGSSPSDPHAGQQRIRVKYHRIRVMQEIPGELPIVFDSNSPPNPLPQSLAPYQAMNKSGFEFWIDRDRQLVEVTGFEQFIDRCLESVRPEDRAAARAALPATSPSEGLAWFVDDSIGLIPADATQPGASWMRSRQVVHPVAMGATTRYTLRPIDPETAEVEISGAIAPPGGPLSSQENAASPEGVEVIVRGGQIAGKCRIDRRSGLPLGSRVEQSLEMTVRVSGGGEFEQFKMTTSTVENLAAKPVLAELTLPTSLALPAMPHPTPRYDSGIDGESRRR